MFRFYGLRMPNTPVVRATRLLLDVSFIHAE